MEAGVLKRPNRDAQFGYGAGQIATGIAQIQFGMGGEAAGVALNLTVVGGPAGVALNVVSAVVIAQGATNVVVGARNVVQAVRRAPEPAQAAAAPEQRAPQQAQPAPPEEVSAERPAEQQQSASRTASGRSTGIRQRDYRGRFDAWLEAQGKDRLPDDYAAHHRVPQAFRGHPEYEGFDFDSPENIRGVKGSKSDVNIHQDIANRWEAFRRANRNASRAQIEEFARQIDVDFQQHWWGQ